MKSKLFILSLIVISILFMGYSHNPPTGRTGAPFDKKCTGCHSSSNPNNYDGTVELVGLPTYVEANKTYPFTVKTTRTAGAPVGAAFQLAIVDSQNNTIGTLIKGPGTGTGTKNGRRYMENRDPRNFNGASSVTWDFEWESPTTVTTAAQNGIKIYMTALITNGNGKTSGDKTIYKIEHSSMQSPCNLTLQTNVTHDVSCSGACDGSVTLTPSNGQAPYTYFWANGSPNINQLCAGNYSVTVTDNLNCSATSQFIIANASPINIDFGMIGKITCDMPSVNVCPSVSGGISPYQYNWSNGNNMNCNSIDSAGNYQLTITDTNGCKKVGNFTIDSDMQPPTIALTNTENMLTVGGCLELSFTSAETQISILWEGPNGWTSTETNPSICEAGTYNLTVTSLVNGCSASASVDIGQYSCDLIVTMSDEQTLNCWVNEISICPTVSNGVGTYHFLWTNGSTDSCLVVSQAGQYDVTVTDEIGCEVVKSKEIVSNTIPPTIVFSQTGYTLTIGGCLELGFTSSESQIDILWQGPNNFTSTDLAPEICTSGEYSLTITSKINGCSNTSNIFINQGTCSLNVDISNSNTITCSNPESTLCANIQGGNAPFTYNWSNGQSSKCISISDGEQYSVTVVDANQCEQIATIQPEINQSAPNITILNNELVLKIGGCLELGFESTENDISVLWQGPNNWTSTEFAPTICVPGIYTLTSTSLLNGCSSISEVEVTEYSCDMTIEIAEHKNLSCFNESVALCASATNGVAPLQYVWNDGRTTNCINVTTSGTYTVSITDDAGCMKEYSTIVMDDYENPTINFDNKDYILMIDGCLKLEFTSSLEHIEIEWKGPDKWTSNIAKPEVCVPGTYELTVTSLENGCSTTSAIEVTQYECSLDVKLENDLLLNCNVGEITLCPSLTGGMKPFAYQWENGSTDSCITVTTSGEYNLIVTDSVGCKIENHLNIDEDFTVPDFQFSMENYVLKEGDCLDLGISTTLDSVSYQWTGPDGWVSNESNPNICVVGTYSLVLTSLSNGCSIEKTLTVELNTKNNDIGNLFFEVFPNPTTHFIQLSFSEKLLGTVSIFSIQGKRLSHQYIEDTKMTINLQDFSKGVYFLKIESDMGIFYEKILKQ